LKIKALWLVLFVFDPKQREFQSYNAICAAGSVTEEMTDQKRIVLNIERLSAVGRNPDWRVTALFLFLPLLAEAKSKQCKEVV
jgi:hypothetical protein